MGFLSPVIKKFSKCNDVILFHAQPAVGDSFRRLVNKVRLGNPVPKFVPSDLPGGKAEQVWINLIPRLTITDELKDFYRFA